MQVLALLAAGSPNQQIAGELLITLDTVKKHVTHVLGKLGAGNRTEAVTRARQLGLLANEHISSELAVAPASVAEPDMPGRKAAATWIRNTRLSGLGRKPMRMPS
jgi:DNA-binding CsgD family transcriptional regulator